MPDIRRDLVFLKELTSGSISNVKTNFQFKFSNYITFYIVDTYDVIEYCFPYLFDASQKNIPISVTNFLSYQFLFLDYPNKPIILDEYKIELFSFWNKLQERISELSKYNNLKEDLLKAYNQKTTTYQKIDFVEANRALLLSLAFGTLSKTPIDRYNSLINDRLQIEHFETENKNDQQIIEDIFYETRPQIEIVDKIFDKFSHHMKKSLIGKSENEKYIFLENAYRDIKVFDRIININKKISSEEISTKLKNKYNFLYLSSAYRSELIQTFYKDYLPQFPGILGDSLRRTNFDTYLFQLLDIKNSNDNQNSIIDFLSILELISTTYSDNARIRRYVKLFHSNYEKNTNASLINRNETEIENIFLKYHEINLYNEKINAAINRLSQNENNDKNDDELCSLFKEVIEIVPTQENVNPFKEIKASLEVYQKNFDMKSEIISDLHFLEKNKNRLKLQFRLSNDFVRSIEQSFPFLLFFKKNISEINALFYYIIKPNKNKNGILANFIELPQNIPSAFTTIERKLFFLFIRYLFDKGTTEDSVINNLTEIMTVNNKRLSLQEGSDWNRIQANRFQIELVYFKSWILRKLNRPDAAIELLNNIIDNTEIDEYDRNDGRLFHSRALCYKNKYYGGLDVHNSKDLLEILLNALGDFNACEYEYMEFAKSNPNNELVSQILLAVSNSISDTFTKLYMLAPKDNSSYIKDCRKRINKIKVELAKINLPYDLFPIWQHTEVDLEYCEALIAIDGNDTLKASKKIEEAYKRLKKIERKKLVQNYPRIMKTKHDLRKLALTLGINISTI